MRQAKLGGKLTPEHRAKIATANTGGHCNRPTGIINPALRKISPSLLTEMKHLREQGLSWSSLAKLSGMCIGPTRRAVLGITYRDATT